MMQMNKIHWWFRVLDTRGQENDLKEAKFAKQKETPFQTAFPLVITLCYPYQQHQTNFGAVLIRMGPVTTYQSSSQMIQSSYITLFPAKI